MDVAEYYQALARKRESIMTQCVSDHDTFAMQIVSHNALKDFERLAGTISGSERGIFIQACREYQYSLEAVVYGNYRHAFSSLRLAFELFTGAVYFSAHQMKMHLWLSGHSDLFWSTVTDQDKGVYSHNFMKAFNPELGQYRAQYMGLSSSVYRECSEYVHGNPSTHDDTTQSATYDAEKTKSYHDKAETVRICVIFLFLSRYLPQLTHVEKAEIESIAIESFGDLPEIQAAFAE